MKLLAIFTLAGIAGAIGGVIYGAGVMATVLPDAGNHGAWYASRAAGIASYLFLWLGLVGGLLMSSAWFDGIVGRAKLLAIHQASSIAGVLLGLGHGLVLIPDEWTQFGYADVLVPFGSYYETSLTAIGTLSLYLGAIVTASFWFRGAIGTRMWKLIHYASFLAVAGALWHGLRIGSDSDQPWLLGMYLTTSLTVVFGLVVRITYIRPAPKRRTAEVSSPVRA